MVHRPAPALGRADARRPGLHRRIFNLGDRRKNHLDLLSAFLLAFRDRPDVTLVIKLATNPAASTTRSASSGTCTRRSGSEHTCRVVVITEFLSDEQMAELFRVDDLLREHQSRRGGLPPLAACPGRRPAGDRPGPHGDGRLHGRPGRLRPPISPRADLLAARPRAQRLETFWLPAGLVRPARPRSSPAPRSPRTTRAVTPHWPRPPARGWPATPAARRPPRPSARPSTSSPTPPAGRSAGRRSPLSKRRRPGEIGASPSSASMGGPPGTFRLPGEAPVDQGQEPADQERGQGRRAGVDLGSGGASGGGPAPANAELLNAAEAREPPWQAGQT